MSDHDVGKVQLRLMNDQLSAMIVTADERQEFLLGALLAQAQALVVRRYGEISAA